MQSPIPGTEPGSVPWFDIGLKSLLRAKKIMSCGDPSKISKEHEQKLKNQQIEYNKITNQHGTYPTIQVYMVFSRPSV